MNANNKAQKQHDLSANTILPGVVITESVIKTRTVHEVPCTNTETCVCTAVGQCQCVRCILPIMHSLLVNIQIEPRSLYTDLQPNVLLSDLYLWINIILASSPDQALTDYAFTYYAILQFSNISTIMLILKCTMLFSPPIMLKYRRPKK